MVSRSFLEANDVGEETVKVLTGEAAPAPKHPLAEVPKWTPDALQEYHRGLEYTDRPEGWGVLTPYAALSEDLQDMIDGAHLRVDSGFDRNYRLADGTYDSTSAEIDNWLVQFERVYHENRGRVPEDFLVDIGEDLALFDGAPDLLQEIARFGHWGSQYEAMAAAEKAAAMQRTKRYQDLYQVGEVEAAGIIRQVDQAWTQIDKAVAAVTSIEQVEELHGWRFDGHEIFERDGKFLANGREYDTREEAFIAQGKDFQRQKEINRWNDVLPQTPTGTSWGDFINGALGVNIAGELFALSGEQKALDVDRGIDESFLGQMTDEAYYLMGKFGEGIGTGADLFGWLTDQVANATGWVFYGDWETADIGGSGIGRWVEENLSEANVIANRNEIRSQAEQTLGLGNQEAIMAAAMFSLPDIWADLPASDPEEYQTLLQMAGGDEKIAFQMFAESVTFAEENREFFQRQADLQRELAATTIRELDNNNYDMGDALLDVLGIWGEQMENAATAVTIGAQMLWDKINEEPGDRDPGFAERYRDSGGTVSGALGVDGTLTGLGVDLLFPALIDPTTWIFGPKLARKGRAGITTAAQLDQVVNSPVTRASIDGLVQVVHSGARPTKGVVTMISEFGTTGQAGPLLRALNGNVDELAGAHLWKEAPYEHLIDEMNIDTVLEHIPDDLLDSAPGGVVDELAERLMDPERPNLDIGEEVVFKYNPTTGELGIISGFESALAMKKAGQRSVPARIKIDTSFGVSELAEHVDNLARGVDTRPPSAKNKVTSQTQRDILDAKGVRPENANYSTLETQPVKVNGAQGELTLYADGVIGPDEGTLVATVDGEVVGRISAVKTPQGPRMQVAVREGFDGAAVLTPDGRSIIDMLYDTGRAQGIEFLEYAGKSIDGVTDDALRSAQRQARRLQESGDFVPGAYSPSPYAKHIDPENMLDWAGEKYVKPSQFFERAQMYGDIDFDHVNAIVRRHYELGGDAPHGHRSLIAVKAANALRADMAKMSKPGRWLERHLTGMNNMPAVSFNQANSATTITQTMLRHHALLGSMDDAAPFINRVFDHYAKQADLEFQSKQLSARIKALEAKKAGMQTAGGIGADDAVIYPGRQPGPFSTLDEASAGWQTVYGDADMTAAAISKNRAAVRREGIRAIDDEIAAARATQKEIAGQVNNHRPLQNLLEEYEADLNRKYLATSPKIREYMKARGIELTKDGRVPQTVLDINRGNTVIKRTIEAIREEGGGIEKMRAAARELRENKMPRRAQELDDLANLLETTGEEAVDAFNRFAKDALHSTYSLQSYHWDLNPLEYLAAAEKGIPYLRKVQQIQAINNLKEIAHKLHNAWMLDKVLTPQTGIKVSIDELYRMHNQGGYKFLYDSVADRLAIRLRRHRWVRQGENVFSHAVNNRLATLEQYPVYFRQIERQLLDGNGVGYDTIQFNKSHGSRSLRNMEYYEAAHNTAGRMLTDEGFQKYLEGPDAFREWFDTDTNALYLRKVEILVPETGGSKMLSSADEAMRIYDTYLEGYALRDIKPSKRARARELYAEAAAAQSARGGVKGGGMVLPEWVLEGFGEVYGKKKHGLLGESVGPVGRLGDRVFQRPVNYRRGRLADMVRTSEWNRLRALYADLGVDIVPQDKIYDLARKAYPEMSEGAFLANADRITNDLLREKNVISERYLHNLVEQKVIMEMENTLYNFHESSLFTKGSKWVAPFGKPYYDMAAHWARDTIGRGNLRPALAALDAKKFGGFGQKVVDALPVNPRTVGKLSRLAATDFDLENMEDDPFLGSLWSHFFGEQDLNMEGFMFLPTQNVQPQQVMIPGYGLGPAWMLSQMFESNGPDPMEDPEGFERYYNQWSDWMPGLGSNNHGDVLDNLWSTLAGGGAYDKGRTGLTLLAAKFLGREPSNPDAFRNNSQWNSQVNQVIRASMTDGKFWDELDMLAAEDVPWDDAAPAYVMAMIDDLVKEATGIQMTERGKEFALEYFTPGRTTPTMVRDEVAKLWIDNLEALGLDPKDFDLSSADSRERASRDISDHFWSLDSELRDILLVENPGLVVNTVSGWQWSDKGLKSDLDTTSPYRFDVETTGARHRYLQREGMIEAIDGQDMLYIAVGAKFAAEKRTVTHVWEKQADAINPVVWNQVVPQNLKDNLKKLFDVGIQEGFFKGIYENEYEMWNDFGGVNGAAQILFDNNYVKQNEDEELVPLTLPDKYSPWSSSMPSSTDNLPEKFTTVQFNGYTDEQTARAAKALGLALPTDGTLTYADLFSALQEVNQKMATNPAYVATQHIYEQSVGTKGAESRAASTRMSEFLNEQPAVYKAAIREYQRLGTLAQELQRAGDPTWLNQKERMDEIMNEFMNDDLMNRFDWNGTHDALYSRTLGPIGWKAPEPAPLFTDDGISSNAQLIIPRGVVDGDTLNFSTSLQDGQLRIRGMVPEAHSLRLLGINAPELSQDGGAEAKRRLEDAIEEAVANGQLIHIVLDTRRARDVDGYGRQLAWLYINGEVYHDPTTITPRG